MKKLLLCLLFLCSLHNNQYCVVKDLINSAKETFNKVRCDEMIHKLLNFFTTANKELLEEYSKIEALHAERVITDEECKERLAKLDDAFANPDEWRERNCTDYPEFHELRKLHDQTCEEIIANHREQIRNQHKER